MKKRRICTICARGGSQGVKGKNLREIMGRPLLSYSVEQALTSGLFDLIAVSSDSDEILSVAKKWDAHVLVKRPPELATDTAAKLPAIRHCFLEAEKQSGLKFDTAVDLDATSPLRSIDDIKGAVSLLENGNFENVITGAPAHRSPYFNMVERSADGRVALVKPSDYVRRQDVPSCFDLNASIYVWKREALLANEKVIGAHTALFEMPQERSLDIDSDLDFEIVEFLMKKRVSNV